MTFARHHWKTLVLLVAAASLSIALFSVFGSPVAPAAQALPAPFSTAQAELSSRFGIDVSPRLGSPLATVSESDAESNALKEFGRAPNQSGVQSTLVIATDNSYTQATSDGTSAPLVDDRPVWLVLIPDVQVPITCPPTAAPCGSSYTATQAVLIDARSGAFLEAAALPSG